MTTSPPYPPTPRWVKVFAIIALLVVLLLVGLLFARAGDHGPARHAPLIEHEDPGAPGP